MICPMCSSSDRHHLYRNSRQAGMARLPPSHRSSLAGSFSQGHPRYSSAEFRGEKPGTFRAWERRCIDATCSRHKLEKHDRNHRRHEQDCHGDIERTSQVWTAQIPARQRPEREPRKTPEGSAARAGRRRHYRSLPAARCSALASPTRRRHKMATPTSCSSDIRYPRKGAVPTDAATVVYFCTAVCT